VNPDGFHRDGQAIPVEAANGQVRRINRQLLVDEALRSISSLIAFELHEGAPTRFQRIHELAAQAQTIHRTYALDVETALSLDAEFPAAPFAGAGLGQGIGRGVGDTGDYFRELLAMVEQVMQPARAQSARQAERHALEALEQRYRIARRIDPDGELAARLRKELLDLVAAAGAPVVDAKFEADLQQGV